MRLRLFAALGITYAIFLFVPGYDADEFAAFGFDTNMPSTTYLARRAGLTPA
jgi:hypothetical protein